MKSKLQRGAVLVLKKAEWGAIYETGMGMLVLPVGTRVEVTHRHPSGTTHVYLEVKVLGRSKYYGGVRGRICVPLRGWHVRWTLERV